MTTTTHTTPEQGAPLHERDALRIVNAFAHLPFAADPHVKTPRHRGLGGAIIPLTPDAIVEALETLAPVLRDHAERARAVEAELADLRRDLAAVRRVLGTEAVS